VQFADPRGADRGAHEQPEAYRDREPRTARGHQGKCGGKTRNYGEPGAFRGREAECKRSHPDVERPAIEPIHESDANAREPAPSQRGQ